VSPSMYLARACQIHNYHRLSVFGKKVIACPFLGGEFAQVS
jgi:hypothetical protein